MQPRTNFFPGQPRHWLALIAVLAACLETNCGGGSSNSAQNTTQQQQQSQTLPPGVRQATFQFGTAQYTYYVFTPSSYNASHPPPAVLLVHGGGGNGLDILPLWRDLAETKGIILVAPTFPLGAQFETQVKTLYPALMDAVRQSLTIDGNRIYVFGYSAGGYTSFDAALLDSTYFAAAGVFAAIITPDYYWEIQQAVRKTPIAIYIGDHDEFFTVAQVQATRDELVANGFTVHLTIYPNQDHNYGAIASMVNNDLWAFFSQYSLPH